MELVDTYGLPDYYTVPSEGISWQISCMEHLSWKAVTGSTAARDIYMYMLDVHVRTMYGPYLQPSRPLNHTGVTNMPDTIVKFEVLQPPANIFH